MEWTEKHNRNVPSNLSHFTDKEASNFKLRTYKLASSDFADLDKKVKLQSEFTEYCSWGVFFETIRSIDNSSDPQAIQIIYTTPFHPNSRCEDFYKALITDDVESARLAFPHYSIQLSKESSEPMCTAYVVLQTWLPGVPKVPETFLIFDLGGFSTDVRFVQKSKRPLLLEVYSESTAIGCSLIEQELQSKLMESKTKDEAELIISKFTESWWDLRKEGFQNPETVVGRVDL